MILFSYVRMAPKKLTKVFVKKTLKKFFQGLIDIREQNQLHIWNQYEKYYQMPYFKSFD